MNPNPLRPSASPGKTDGLVPPVLSRFGCGVRLRASLPVASNRAFIRAWAARRTKADAALAAARRLAK